MCSVMQGCLCQEHLAVALQPLLHQSCNDSPRAAREMFPSLAVRWYYPGRRKTCPLLHFVCHNLVSLPFFCVPDSSFILIFPPSSVTLLSGLYQTIHIKWCVPSGHTALDHTLFMATDLGDSLVDCFVSQHTGLHRHTQGDAGSAV